MSRRSDALMVPVRDRWTIRLHWFNAFCWLLLVGTGLGIVSGESLRLAPAFWPEFLQNLLGGNTYLVRLHAFSGLAWVGVIGLFAALRWRTVVRPFLRRVLVLTPGQAARAARSMVITLAHLLGLMGRTPVPPEGRYNGAQRLLGTLIVFASGAIAASGVYLFFGPGLLDFAAHPLYGALFRWALVVHAGAVFLVLTGLVAHIYFALVEEPQSLESMRSGRLSADYIRHGHALWYEELRREGRL
jgi:formate dehydrogenase subunit gamma